MSNSLQDVVNASHQLCEPPYFSWWNYWIPDAYWAAYLSIKKKALVVAIHMMNSI